MPAVTVNYLVSPGSVQRSLTRLEAALSGAGIGGFLGGTIDPYIRDRVSERFAGEGDDVVGKWIPLASTTEKIRQEQGFGAAHPINRRTGQLEDFITGSPHDLLITDSGASLVMPGVQPTGELEKKVRTAQAGDPGNPGQRPTPPRPVIGVNEKDLLFTLTALEMFIERAIL